MSWLKIEITTPYKPEITQISRLCSCSKADAFLAFFKFMAWADSITEDGFIEFLTEEDCDDHAGLKGFGKAFATVKWIDFRNGGAYINNFDRHNGQSAKRRTLDTERKRKERAK